MVPRDDRRHFARVVEQWFHSLVDNVPDVLSVIAPKRRAVHVVVRDPERIVVAVRLRIARMAEARERNARRPDEREDEGTVEIRPAVVARDLLPVALKGNLVIR